ncbi:MAG: transporter substrate-binding domain-containing protein, partial [Muribaculaceae bacterium]|nr:transporter substrate-binding domain-containing protein [Muribaculaceae bacterium]
KQQFLFTDPVYLDRQVLVQRKDPETGKAKVNSQLDLAGCTLHIVKGSPMKERIEGLSREIGGDIHIVVDDIYGPEQLFLQVATGEIEYAVINESIAASLVKDYSKEVDVATAISFSQFQSWVLNKNDSTLCGKLNMWLKQAQELPQYGSLVSRYFPDDKQQP